MIMIQIYRNISFLIRLLIIIIMLIVKMDDYVNDIKLLG